MAVTIEEPVGPLAEKELAKVEKELKVRFPDDYRAFMLAYNGGRPEPDEFDIQWKDGQKAASKYRTSAVSWFFSIWDEPDANLLDENEDGATPEGTIAIATDAGGKPILLGVSGPHKGHVLFMASTKGKPSFDNVGFLAASFDEFLNKALR